MNACVGAHRKFFVYTIFASIFRYNIIILDIYICVQFLRINIFVYIVFGCCLRMKTISQRIIAIYGNAFLILLLIAMEKFNILFCRC